VLTDEERRTLQQQGRDTRSYETEIWSGVLRCTDCSSAFPVWKGVPRIYKNAEEDFPVEQMKLSTMGLTDHKDQKSVQASFSHEWDDFEYRDQSIWLWTLEDRIATFSEEISVGNLDELRGKMMVDAGCGTGLLSMALSGRFLVEIIAFDMAFIVGRAFENNGSNLCHFVQGSVLAPPLRDAIADITYSHGVLHHTYSTEKAFAAISRLTKPRGMLYVWLYGRKHGWNRVKYIMIDALRVPISRLPKYPQTLAIGFLVGFHRVIRGIKRLANVKVANIRTKNQMLVVTRDRYTPKYAREHTEAEVTEWFEANGYTNVSRRTAWTKTKLWIGSTDLAIKGYRAESVG
jgi:SAM-dependent methyltransferase